MRNFGSPYGVLATREAQRATKKGKPKKGLRYRVAKRRQKKRERAIARIKRTGRSPGGSGSLSILTRIGGSEGALADTSAGFDSSGGANGSMTVMDESFEEPTLFEMYRTPILVAGVLALVGGGYYFAKKKGWL